ncbi:MAG: hypothetical protein R2715_15095 [Ilumatobacteraceae bacterium]
MTTEPEPTDPTPPAEDDEPSMDEYMQAYRERLDRIARTGVA